MAPTDRRKMKLTAILGHPITHSLSPTMHTAAFAALDMDWVYVPVDVLPADLANAVRGLRALGFRGASVTVPHKQAMIPLLDEVTEAARTMGAVNTIVRRGDRLIGDNTDWQGFLVPLREAGFDLAGQRCAVLGAGGAARAVVYALGRAGATAITIFNRTVSRANDLIRDLQPAIPAVALRSRSLAATADLVAGSSPALVVNTTSVGMWPETDGCPWPADRPIPSETVVYDLVYNPLRTRLLRQAEEAGCRTIDGVRMLVHQGAIAFKMWTGREPPVEVMYDAVRNLL